MIIGPLTIRWTKDVRAEEQARNDVAQEAQRLDLRRNSVIASLHADRERMQHIMGAMALKAQQRKEKRRV